jgi:dolichol-phosphate mannosyltransferase
MLQLRSLRIIIPAYNEAGRIGPTIRDYCETFTDSATVLVVANGCVDDTVGIVEALQAEYSNLELIAIAAQIGKGGAVRTGLWTGKEEFIGFVDADGSTKACEYARLFEVLRDSDDDALIGSRWIRGSRVEPRQPLKRRVASRAFNALVQLLFGFPFADTQCGAKLFRRRAISEVAHSLQIANFAFDIEVLWHLRRSNFTVREEPTVWSDCIAGSAVKLLPAALAMLRSILRLRVRQSALWLLPIIDRFIHEGVMPVIDRHRLLVLADVSELRLRDQRIASFFDALIECGFHVYGLESETQGSWLGDLWRRSDIIGASATLFWYALSSHKDFDAIVELSGRKHRLISSITLKPSFVVTSASQEHGYRPGTYARGLVVDLERIDSRGAAEIVALAQRDALPYAGIFVREPDSVALHCPDASGDWKHHLLHH